MADTALSPAIRLHSIDYDHLEDVEDNPEAVLFRVLLSAVPAENWRQEFLQAYQSTPYGIKPPLRIEEDAIDIIFLPRYAPELPGFFRFLNLMARRADDETRLTEQIHAAASRDRHKAEFRDALSRIDLSQ